MPTFDEILAQASLPEDTVTLCLNGVLANQVHDLERQLLNAQAPTSLGERSQASVIAEQIEALREQMRASEVDFRLRALPGREWRKLHNRLPVRSQSSSDEEFNDRFFAWTTELVSRSCFEPAMAPEQVIDLVDRLPGSSWDALSGAAWALNAGKVNVPFSSAVSALTQISGSESRRQPGSVSASPDSTESSKPKRRRMSTTSKAD